MISLVRMYINNNRNIINIVVFSFVSVILLSISWLVDINGLGSGSTVLSKLALSKDISTAFLASLAGVFLTVTTFSFTTILTVLNKYSTEYTPRIVQDFIDKPFVLSLFGIFIGGFFYSVFSLLMIQNIDKSSKAIAGTMGLLYAMASMIYFILFVKTVLKSIKTSDVIEYVYNRAAAIIEKAAQKAEGESKIIYEMYEVSEELL